MKENSSMTARVSAFSRAYHSKNNKVKVFDDYIAEKLLTAEEYQQIAVNMQNGISYFNPGFKGSKEEALRFIVNHQLAPSPLGRTAFTEALLEKAIKEGAIQYLIFAAGFDSFAYRQPEYAKQIQIFEIDHPATSQDKQNRVKQFLSEKPSNLHYIQADFREIDWEKAITQNVHFNSEGKSFCSLLGIAYYLTKQDFEQLIKIISRLVKKENSIAFDYPSMDVKSEKFNTVQKQTDLVKAAGETMLAQYEEKEIEEILLKYGFKTGEHLRPDEITEKYFKAYNLANPQGTMKAFNNVNYCYVYKVK